MTILFFLLGVCLGCLGLTLLAIYDFHRWGEIELDFTNNDIEELVQDMKKGLHLLGRD